MVRERMTIRKGVRQGCILSWLLFNIYSEQVFREALEETTEGIKIIGEVISNIRYADDAVIVANDCNELQRLMQRKLVASHNYGLELNIAKTNCMHISKTQQPPLQITINNRNMERAETYSYLRITINSKWDQSAEIRGRIEKARNAFNSLKNWLTSKISIDSMK